MHTYTRARDSSVEIISHSHRFFFSPPVESVVRRRHWLLLAASRCDDNNTRQRGEIWGRESQEHESKQTKKISRGSSLKRADDRSKFNSCRGVERGLAPTHSFSRKSSPVFPIRYAVQSIDRSINIATGERCLVGTDWPLYHTYDLIIMAEFDNQCRLIR